jgi:hypothetical protein
MESAARATEEKKKAKVAVEKESMREMGFQRS